MFGFSTLDQNMTKFSAETVNTWIYNSTTAGYLEVSQQERKNLLWFVIISMFFVLFGLTICVAIYTLKEKRNQMKRKAERLKRSEKSKANKIIKNNGKRNYYFSKSFI
jgi:hypothetical protein